MTEIDWPFVYVIVGMTTVAFGLVCIQPDTAENARKLPRYVLVMSILLGVCFWPLFLYKAFRDRHKVDGN